MPSKRWPHALVVAAALSVASCGADGPDAFTIGNDAGTVPGLSTEPPAARGITAADVALPAGASQVVTAANASASADGAPQVWVCFIVCEDGVNC